MAATFFAHLATQLSTAKGGVAFADAVAHAAAAAGIQEVLLDSGASYHLVPVGEEVAGTVTAGEAIELQTVAGPRTYTQNAAMDVGPVGRQAGLVVDADSPAVLSMGQLVVAGYSFRWNASDPERPTLIDPDGREFSLAVRANVPVISRDCATEFEDE